MKKMLGLALATTLIAGSALAQTAVQPSTQQPQKPLFPWQRNQAAPAAPTAQTPAAPTYQRPTFQRPAAPAAPTTMAPGQDGREAARARQKQCGAEWRTNKATLQPQYGSWPKYWSACNTRIKTTGR